MLKTTADLTGVQGFLWEDLGGEGRWAALLPGTTGREPPQEEQALHSKPEQIPSSLGTGLQRTAGETGDRRLVDNYESYCITVTLYLWPEREDCLCGEHLLIMDLLLGEHPRCHHCSQGTSPGRGMEALQWARGCSTIREKKEALWTFLLISSESYSSIAQSPLLSQVRSHPAAGRALSYLTLHLRKLGSFYVFENMHGLCRMHNIFENWTGTSLF